MSYVLRNSIKVILLNNHNELLLMLVDDPRTTSVDGKSRGKFWCLIGGEIEQNETLNQAAIREIYEETGIKKEDVELGPVVWFGEFDLILSGKFTHFKQKFIVAKTKKNKIALEFLTREEKAVVQSIEWFSLEKMKNCKEVVYPVGLSEYLSDILAGKYPENPIEIDLAKKPE
jgi:8-oxo-dGTP pyrophosphatase MutT (NUDIX family)